MIQLDFVLTVVHNDTHTHEQFLNLHVGLGLDFVFVCLFSDFCWLSSFYTCVACFCCVGV